MPSQKELDNGKKLKSRGPAKPETKWRYRLRDNNDWMECYGDTADTALRSVGKSLGDIWDVEPCIIIKH